MVLQIEAAKPEWILWGSGGVFVGILLAGLVGWMIFRRKKRHWIMEREALNRRLEQNVAVGESLQRELTEERLARIRAETSLEWIPELSRMLEKREAEIAGLQEALKESAAQRSALASRLEEQERHYSQLTGELKEAREELQRQFRSLAGEIMEENALRFQSVSREGVAQILRPLQQQVERFRKRVDEVHTQESREMAALLTEIRTLRELNRQISDEARNLTRALKGEHKSQGIWGEMVLERILEASGLREGEEFEREMSLRDGEARRFRPDVIVHLPGGRDVVIDAKTSLNAYERYIAAESEEERRIQARAHLQAVKAYIGELGDKNYANLEGIETLDFIFMFLPIEGALSLAMQEDPRLYERALERQIILVSPTTLLVALRAVESSWKQERRNRNAREIAKRAGALYDKFALFAADLEKLGRQIETLRGTYETTWNRLGTGRGNILRQIEGIRELGARTSKELPKKLREEMKEG